MPLARFKWWWICQGSPELIELSLEDEVTPNEEDEKEDVHVPLEEIF